MKKKILIPNWNFKNLSEGVAQQGQIRPRSSPVEPNRLSSFARNCVLSVNTTNTKPQQCNPLPSQPCLGGTIPPAQVLMQFELILKAKRSFGLFFSKSSKSNKNGWDLSSDP